MSYAENQIEDQDVLELQEESNSFEGEEEVSEGETERECHVEQDTSNERSLTDLTNDRDQTDSYSLAEFQDETHTNDVENELLTEQDSLNEDHHIENSELQFDESVLSKDTHDCEIVENRLEIDNWYISVDDDNVSTFQGLNELVDGPRKIIGPDETEDKCKKVQKRKKTYECPVCWEKFNKLRYLKKHQDDLHPGDKLFRCKYCSKEFSQKVHLKTHAH